MTTRICIWRFTACVLAVCLSSHAVRAQPDDGVQVGLGIMTRCAFGYYFTDTKGVDLIQQFCLAADWSYAEGMNTPCMGNPTVIDENYSDYQTCSTPGCAASASVTDPFFGHFALSTWGCEILEDLSWAVTSDGSDLPVESNPSYLQAYAGIGLEYQYDLCNAQWTQTRNEFRAGTSVASLFQNFEIDDQVADFSLGWVLCYEFLATEWGDEDFRPWRPGPIVAAPEIGDYVSFPRMLVGIELAGMDPSEGIAGVFRNWESESVIPDGEVPLGAPDGAGVFEDVQFSYSVVGGSGKDDYLRTWSWSFSDSVSSANYVGPTLSIAFRSDPVPATFGDVNQDGKVSSADVTALSTYLMLVANPPWSAHRDIDRDGDVDSDDLAALTAYMALPGFASILLGDVNDDGVIDEDDLTAIKGQIDKSWGDANFSPQADIDQDGTVTTADESLLEAYLKK